MESVLSTANRPIVEHSGRQSRALLVFLENSGDVGSVLQFLGHSPNPTLGQAIESQVDYWIEKFEKWHLRFDSDEVRKHYDQVEILEDETATETAFKDTMKNLANAGFVIDVITIGHGGHKKLYGFKPNSSPQESITDATLAALTTEFSGRLPIRLVYMMNCQGSSLNEDWLKAGASVSAGSLGDNYVPEPWLNRLWQYWLAGEPFAVAVGRGFDESKEIWSALYSALEFAGMLPNNKTAAQYIADSAPVIKGTRLISIDSIKPGVGISYSLT